jgi:glycerol-3-phosphate responsive antiterminator
MKLFILYQTEIWKDKNSKTRFGIFATKKEAIETAKKHNLYNINSEVIIDAVFLNEIGEFKA